jgi:hypothetical protein
VSRRLTPRALPVALVVGALALAGCGTSASHRDPKSQHPPRPHHSFTTDPLPRAHPQAIQPVAGGGPPSGGGGAPTVGDPTAHAPSLKTVKRELVRLNLCGGATSAADAAPIVTGAGPGFVADPGTQQTEGRLPELTAELNALGKSLGVTIFGISGYRSPAHSVAVGGFANDPHTRGEAEDVGVDSLLRSSAARITEAQLAQFHLYRPFDPSDDPNNTEVNHLQLIPHGGPLSLATATATYDPDPSCT